MKSKTLRLKVVASTIYPDMLSIRLEDGSTGLRQALKNSGFEKGDELVLTIAKNGGQK